MFSRGVILVLLWTALIHQVTVYSTIDLVIGVIASEGEDVTYIALTLLTVQGLCFLIYPLCGLAADVYWTRFNTMYAGTCIQLVGTLLLLPSAIILYFDSTTTSSVYIWIAIAMAYALIQIGLALFESNAIQFGTDQMLTASSDELSSFVYWYFWAIFVGHFVNSCLKLILVIWTTFSQAQGITLICGCCIQLLYIGIILPAILLSRRRFVLEPVKNPLKPFVGVLKYAIKHKKPIYRSAFTYGELYPSRIDMGKERYGGSFTTEEVEDAKTVLRILLVMVASVGFRLADETGSTSAHVTVLLGNSSQTVWHQFITSDTFGISTIVIVVCIPIYQLVIVRRNCTYRFLPTMLKRIFVGLLLALLATASLQVIEVVISLCIDEQFFCNRCNVLEPVHVCFSNNSVCYISESYLIFPQFLNGLSFLFVYLTIMEFILAQSPRSMQGFLIGVWYSMQFLSLLIGAVESLHQINCWEYLTGAKTIIMLFMIPVFMIVGMKYKRRIREEPSNVNNYAIIENYYMRKLEKDKDIDFETSYHDVLEVKELTL